MTVAGPPAEVPAAQRSRRPLGVVLSAYLVSVACTAVSAITLPWLVLTTTGSASRTGLVVFAELAPYVLMQALAGPWVERFGPRRASRTGNLLAGLVLGLVPVLHLAGELSFGGLLVLVAAVGGLRGVADCGSAPLVPGTARRARVPLERAAGLHASVSQGGHLVGAPLGGLLLTFLEPALVLAVSGAGICLAGLVVGLGVPRTVGAPAQETDPDSPRTAYRTRLVQGLAFLVREPVLRGLVVMIAATNLISMGLSGVLLPSWVRDQGLSVAVVGTVAGALALGGLGGSLLGSWLAPRMRRWATYSVGFLVGGPPVLLVLAVGAPVPVVVGVAVAAGLASGGINPIVGAVQFERVPEPMLPRVLGAVKAVAWVGLPVGPLAAGALTDAVGVQAALFTFGGLFLAVALAPLVLPSFRLMDQRPAEPAREPEAVRAGAGARRDGVASPRPGGGSVPPAHPDRTAEVR